MRRISSRPDRERRRLELLDPSEFGIGLKKQEKLEYREQTLVLSLLRHCNLLRSKPRLYQYAQDSGRDKRLALEDFAAAFPDFPLRLGVANKGQSVISAKGGRKLRFVPLLDRGEFKFEADLKQLYFSDRTKDPCLLLLHEHVGSHYLAITLNRWVGPKSNALQFYSKVAGAMFAIQTLPSLGKFLQTTYLPPTDDSN